MDYTLTLVASNIPLSAGHLASIEHFIDNQNILMTGDPEWLTPHKAASIPISECLNMAQMQDLRTVLAEYKIDVFCTRTENRKKTLLMADMDSTIVTEETLDELAAEAGLKDKISFITERAMRGELDFEQAIEKRVGLLKDLPTDALKRTLDKIKISKGANTLINTMRHNGCFCALISGGFTYFTSEISAKLGFTAHHGNILEIKNNKLTGKVKKPILDKDAKLRFLKLYCEELEIDLSDTIAIGDGANDLPMLQAAGIGIGYHPKPLLEESLLNCIHFTDLTSILYVQGYNNL